MSNTTKATVGRPKFITSTQEFTAVRGTKGTFRLDAADKDSSLMQALYLMRGPLKAAGLPEGRVPSKVRVTVEVVKHEAAPAEAAE